MENIRPLARWTLGPVMKAGRAIFKRSFKAFQELHPEFDNIVCYNNLNRSDSDMLNILDQLWDQGVPLHEQHCTEISYPIAAPTGELKAFGWKLLPARLRPDAHELWIDNDILFQDRLPDLDIWLKKSTGLILEGIAMAHGRFTHMNTIQACAGFFGLPPDFDFETEILWRCQKNLGGLELDGHDEQGLVASIVTRIPDFMVVPQTVMTTVDLKQRITYKDLQVPAIHFVGANRTDSDPNFTYYLSNKMKTI